jgi:sec-independent protein translocase protein TatC
MDEAGLPAEHREQGFGDHLETLRKHLFRIIIAIISFSVIAFVFKSYIFDFILLSPQSPDFAFSALLCRLGKAFQTSALCFEKMNFVLINVSVTGQFMLHISVSLIAGVVMAFPYLLWEIWRFIRPALTVVEQTAARGIVFFASVLFFIGLAFGYFIITPLAFSFFGNYVVSNSLENLFTIQSYFSMLTRTCIATGIAFELPLIIYFFSRAGLATPKGLKKYRRHAVIALFLFAALITPADPFSMILVAVPLLLLYEFSILISKNSQPKRH